MKLPRRQFLHLAASAAALPAASRFAWAQAYPTRPVRLIVGFPAGGSASDIVARLMGQWLSERLGQQFVVENRPGAATNLATEAVVRAPPDGYTLLFVTATNALNHTLYNNLNFNFIRDIAPVASIYRTPFVMLVNPSVPVPGYEASGWSGVGSPKSTPTEVIDKLNREINTALADPKIKAQLADLGSTPLVGSPTDFGKLIADETEKWGNVIRALNIKAE